MITWLDFVIKQQHHQEQLREAEQNRLIRQIGSRRRNPALWQKIGNRLSGRSKDPVGEGHGQLIEEAA